MKQRNWKYRYCVFTIVMAKQRLHKLEEWSEVYEVYIATAQYWRILGLYIL